MRIITDIHKNKGLRNVLIMEDDVSLDCSPAKIFSMGAFKSSDPRQEQTNRMMLWMMPIMFGFFTLSFPAGLATYIIFSNIAGFFIQIYVLKKLKVKNTLKEFLTLSSPQRNEDDSTKQNNNNEEAVNELTAIPRQDSRGSNKARSRRAKRKSRRG